MSTDIKIGISSPCYLGSGDQPSNLITHVILKPDNYVAWSRAITLSLKARRKFVFINRTLAKPMDSTIVLDWDTVNSMIISWILQGIHPKVVESIPFHDNAKQLWDYLESRFCISIGPRIQQLPAPIADCHQIISMFVEYFYNKLAGLYYELNRLNPLHVYSCGKCSCDVVSKFTADRREEIFHQFLLGIDDDYYSGVRSILLSQVPPVNLDRAYQEFTQEERARNIARERVVKEENHAFALQAPHSPDGRIDGSDKTKLVCRYCKQMGHEQSSCFELYGYPAWYLERRHRSRAG
ncbi:Carbonic anhydrase 2 [Bienertia sinuspersici]